MPQGTGLHAFLAETGQYVGDVAEIGLVRPDDQDPAAVVSQTRIGVQQVRRAVQRDDRLTGSRTTLDDQRAA